MHEIQRAYEEIREYFSRPGAEIARNTNDGCEYLTHDGRKCAVGARIPAEWIENRGRTRVNDSGSIAGLVETFPEAVGIVGELGSLLFVFHSEAQCAHDSSETTGTFIWKLDALAQQYGLRVVVGDSAPVTPQAELVLA